jgi:NitT/TauT family transport system substrate-binding protein
MQGRSIAFMSTLALGILSCGISASAQSGKIIINQSAQSLSAAAVYLANDEGYFKDEGLEAEFVVTGSGLKSIVPLISGSTQFCACVFSHVINAVATGAGNVKMIASVTNGYSQKLVLSRDIATKAGITDAMPLKDRIQALKGLKIGISEPNSAADQVARLILREGGLDPDRDTTLISLGVPNLIAALHNHQIDAFVVTAPHPELAVQQGDAVTLVDLAKDKIGSLSDATYIGVAADADYLKANHEVAGKVVKALGRAEAFMQLHPDEAKAVLKDKEFPQMDQSVFDISFEAAFPFFAKTPAVADTNVSAALDLANKFSKQPLTLKPADLVDKSLSSGE